jgi:hypothetical protein
MIDVDISFFHFVFDNYYEGGGPSFASPVASHSKRIPGDVFLDDSSCADSIQQELAELRQQLQAMKKQAITVMDQSRKSSEREKMALHQAQEALELKEAAVAEALLATSRENYMLDLMTDASLDMAGTLHFVLLFPCQCSYILSYVAFLFLILGSFIDAVAENQRVDSQVEILLRLANQNNSDFWASEDRTRRIVRFQDRAAQVREFLEFCTSTLAMVYNAMFPRNPQPKSLPELMKKFKNVNQIHNFVKAQLMAGARFALI